MVGKYRGTSLATASLSVLSGVMQFLGYLFLATTISETGIQIFLQGTIYGILGAFFALLAFIITSKYDWEESFFQSSSFYLIIIVAVSLLFVSSINGIRASVLYLL